MDRESSKPAELKFLILIILLITLAGCQSKGDIATYRKLQILDSEFVRNYYYYYEPSALSAEVNESSKFIDSLKSIDEKALSKRKYNRSKSMCIIYYL